MELLHGYYQQRSAKSLTILFEAALQYREEESNLIKLTRTFSSIFCAADHCYRGTAIWILF
jgi:hypothetical protein